MGANQQKPTTAVSRKCSNPLCEAEAMEDNYCMSCEGAYQRGYTDGESYGYDHGVIGGYNEAHRVRNSYEPDFPKGY